jgi:HAD superfamily hydrolase (TIGR01490 family)
MPNKKVAIFDIDGTIFRSSLLIEAVEALIAESVFPSSTRKMYAVSYQRWFERKDSYEKYIRDIITVFEKHIKNVSYTDFVRICNNVVTSHQHRTYRYTRDLVKKCRQKGYFLLAISNSPQILVDAFCRYLEFNKAYGRIYEVNNKGKFTGKTLYEDIISDKAKVLQRAVEKQGLTLKGSFGVGDSETDAPFLSLVDNPICFNPNAQLYHYAKSKKWKVVIERKDVIYELGE